uniref:SH3 domain-containing protein n=1 Tax=Macrostomum lignano TaxID=282301 RepID=A0A1I8FGF7_9PLAT
MRIVVKKKPASGWWNGEVVENGVKRIGWFPASYTKLEQPSVANDQRPASRQSVTSNQSMPTSAAPVASAAPQDRLKKSSVHTAGAASVSASTPDLFASAGKKAATPTHYQAPCPLSSSPRRRCQWQPAMTLYRLVITKLHRLALNEWFAKYRYQARNDDELTFEKGTIITVISKDSQTGTGQDASLREGLFPCKLRLNRCLSRSQMRLQMVVNELTNQREYLLQRSVWRTKLDAIFPFNWTDLMNCSYSLLMAL